MVTAFLNKSDRGMTTSDKPSDTAVGPGSYMIPGAMQAPLPGFTGFSTTSKRSTLAKRDAADEPAPGDYDLTASMLKQQSIAANAFKSKTKRFIEKEDNAPGPIALASTLKHGRPKMYPRASRHNGIDQLEHVSTHNPPSIPAKNQLTGYETNPHTGKLALQDPVEPGFAGTKYNSVGPGDYEPKIDIRYKAAAVPTFKGSERAQMDRYLAKAANAAPGPGYYNYRSSFDEFADPRSADEADFVLHLKVSRKKLSASFASGTDRSSMLREVLKQNVGKPGPGAYVLPSSMSKAELGKPENLQCFASSSERFFQPSYNLSITSPGMYTVPTEFESARLRILKKKKLVSRSGWAYNVAFDSTGTRKEIDHHVGPPPGAYVPTNYDLGANVAKENVRAGPFGSSSKRFVHSAGSSKGVGGLGGGAVLTREQQLAQELERDMNENQARWREEESNHSNSRTKLRLHKSAFGVGLSQARFVKDSDTSGPAPGSYDTTPSWVVPGAVSFRETNISSRKLPDMMPGPGDYSLPSALKYGKPNRKGVMISTGQRSQLGQNIDGPGPGEYKVTKSLIRPSYNIMLAEPAAR